MTTPKPTTGELVARIELLEHALHETRQRADFITWALWDLASEVVPHVWVDPFREVPPPSPHGDQDARDEARRVAWERLGLDAVWGLFCAPHLEITHLEGHEPEDPRVPGTPPPLSHAAALLAGARERFDITGGIAGSLTVTKDPA